MHTVTLGKLSDRELLSPSVSPDLLEQLHPWPHPDRPSRRQPTGTIWTTVGPTFVTTHRTHPAEW